MGRLRTVEETAEAHPRAQLAAGILLAAGVVGDLESLDAIDDQRLLDKIDATLTPSTLWLPAEGMASDDRAVVHSPVADWVDPGVLDADDAERLDHLMGEVVDRRVAESAVSETGSIPAIRVRVREAEDAHRLAELKFPTSLYRRIPVAAGIVADTRAMPWGWPLDVAAVVEDAGWLDQLRSSSHHPYLYEVRRIDGLDVAPDRHAIVRPDRTSGPEIMVVDASIDQDELRGLLPVDPEATCLIVAGDVEASDENLRLFVNRFGAAVTILMPGDPHSWWSEFFHELCHDKPADVAAAMANPDALIAVPSKGVEFTGAAAWVVEAGNRHPALADLARRMLPRDFLSEDLGTSAARGVTENIHPRPEVSIGRDATRAAIGGEGPDSPPPPDTERYLIANVIDDAEDPIRSALAPETDLRLVVKIAVPDEKVDTFDPSEAVPDLPPSDRPTKLEVVVQSDLWPAAQTQEIVLATAQDRLQEPSSPAVFDFTTPTSGKIAEFDITVFHKGRPLQAATLQVPVQARPLSSHRPQLSVRTLSGPSEPSDDASVVDIYLDLRGNTVKDRNGNPLVAIGAVDDYLDLYDRDFSQILGDDDAPAAWSDPDGRELLVKMANNGALFRNQFGNVDGLDKAKVIELRVLASSKLLPIELMYLGPAPDDDAELCDHVATPLAEPTVCIPKSSKIVCPYGFLGINCVISRTIDAGPEENAAGGTNVRIVPMPTTVLYAATTKADVGSSAPKPSKRLEATAKKLFSRVNRVTSWTAWQKAVKSIGDEPRVLVVLGHTEHIGNKVLLQIGRKSVLKQAKIKEYLRIGDGGGQRNKPVVVLMACSSSLASTGPFHALPSSFVLHGAGSVIATLSKINGSQAATAAEAFLQAMVATGNKGGRLSEAITDARQNLVKQGLPASLVVVANGDIDLRLN